MPGLAKQDRWAPSQHPYAFRPHTLRQVNGLTFVDAL